MSALAEAKRAFYAQPRVAQRYDDQRFGGASGAYVNSRELSIVAELLPSGDVLADVGCGTGRLLRLLNQRAHHALALDASMAMLERATRACHPEQSEGPSAEATGVKILPSCAPQDDMRFVQGNIFGLPVRGGALDGATCLRMLFHFDDVRPLLRELRRAVRPGGVLVCDTSTWSPRGLLPVGRRAWGERVVALSRAEFRRLAQESGWRVQAERACFLISPHMYRLLPLPLARALERLERRLPAQWLCRVFWQLEAAA